MGNSMQHWNGNQMCVIDTETTGLNPLYNEIIQIAILPLDSNIVPRKDVAPFYINLIPEFPERADREAMKINKINIKDISVGSLDKEKAKDLLIDWIGKLGLPTTKWGNPKKIIPLGQNYAFDRSFIEQWLGRDMYEEYFHYAFRDTMRSAIYLNDRAACHAEKVPYSKVGLGWLCSQLKVQHERGHDALQDCISTAEVYRRLIAQGVMG